MSIRTKFSLLVLLASAFVFVSCFSVSDTLGNACVVDNDCDGAQICSAQVCSIGELGLGGAVGQGGEVLAPEPDVPEGFVRLVHSGLDLGPVDVFVAGTVEPVARNVEYKEVSPWIPLEQGQYEFELRPAGSESGQAPLISIAELELQEDERVTLVAAGLQNGTANRTLRILPIRENWAGDLAERARIRMVHAGVDAPEFVVDGLESPSFTLPRFESSAPGGEAVSVEGGEQIQLIRNDELVTSFTLPPLAQGTEVLLIGTGLLGSLARDINGFGFLAVGPEGALERILQDPQVFTLHGARDAGALENCTDGFELAANIKYGEIQSTFISPGEYDFEIFGYPSGCNIGALNPGGNSSPQLDAGERYLLLITGELTPDPQEPAIQVATFRDRFSSVDEDGANVRFIHGASFTQIFVGNVTGGSTITAPNVYTDPIAWRQESREASIPEGTYVLGIADANLDPLPEPPLDAIVTFDFEAAAGKRLWGVVSGDPIIDNENDGAIQLMLVDTSTPEWSTQLVDP